MVCLIPMRSGSRRLHNKNITDFFGKPIFSYPLLTAVDSRLFSKIIIAADEEYYNDVIVQVEETVDVGRWGKGQIYKREKQNSRDESPLIDLVREVVDA